MSMMLKAIYAMRLNSQEKVGSECEKVETEQANKEVKNPISRAEAKAQCELQLSVIVKMSLDGCSVNEIIQATGVKKSFVASTRKQFDILRPKLDDEKAQIRKILMESPDYTHKVSSICKLTGYKSEKVSKIIAKMPQAERGKEEGLKYNYRYNFDVKIGTSRGFVG